MRLIDADALVEDLSSSTMTITGLRAGKTFLLECLTKYKRGVVRIVHEAPTISPDSLRSKGQWIGEGDGYADGELVYDVWYCSECNHCIDDGTDDPEQLPNFCPNCGADMTGDKT